MKKVGILGGTFNPPHIGHLIIANEVYDALNLDEVRFMPNAVPPHKMKDGDASAKQRLKMTELSIQSIPYFSVEKCEIERGGISYTYDTMEFLSSKENETKFYFIIGGDMIDFLPKWYKIDELLQIVSFVGVGRPNSEGRTDYNIQYVDIPQVDLSSSLIRERLKIGKTVTFLIPSEVEQYIYEEGLYGNR